MTKSTYSQKQDRWFCATNTDNMRNIIAQGLITEPAGFTKYYSDALEIHLGWIPLFKNEVPTNILEKSVSETSGLTTCIIEFSLNTIDGLIKAYGETNSDELLLKYQLIDLQLTQLADYSVDALFIPSPLPTSCIKTIFFSSNEEKTAFSKDASIYNNVSVIGLDLKVNKKLFSKGSTAEYLQKITLPEQTKISYPEVYAFGGMLAILFYFSKNGVISNKVYHCCGDFVDITEDAANDIKLIYHFFKKNTALETEISKMYHGLLQAIINSKDAKESIISYLKNMDNFEVDKSKNRAQQLSRTLLEFESIAKKTASEQFNEAKTPLERMLLMLFLREDTQGLTAYSLEQFNESDYLLFAMVFGIRDKLIKMPKSIREIKGLQNFISTKMANYAHQNLGSNITFSKSSKTTQPITLGDMFENNDFKIWFAKKQLKINYFQTTIKMPIGAYTINSTKSGLELIFDGDPDYTKIEVIEDQFYKAVMSKNTDLYNKYLAEYNKIK